MTNKIDKVYSYHTFIFPFIWEEKELPLEKFIVEGENKCRWEPDKLLDKAKNVKEKQFAYSQFQYFIRPARELIFEEKSVKHFTFQLKAKQDEYIIKKDFDDEPQKEYRLKINGIRLNLVPENHIGIMIFECENHCFPELSDIQRINQYGRRVLAPYVAPEISCDELADEIEVAGYKEHFLSQITTKNSENLNLHHVANFIKKLISLKENITSDTEKFKSESKEFYIEPLIDDRMYVCSLIKNTNLICEVKQFNDEYAYLNQFETSKKLYSLINIDSGSATLQSRTTIKKVLSHHVYDRWIEDKTIHAATHHSLMMLTSEDVPDHVINSFLTEYVEMAVLAVLQRSTLLEFSKEATEISEDSGNEKKRIEKINKLYEKYIIAQNQIMLEEVTVEEQGVELFDIIRKGLYIPERDKELKDQIMNLNALATSWAEEQHLKRNNVLNVLVSVLGILAILATIYSQEIKNLLLTAFSDLQGKILGGLIIICLMALWYRYCRKNKRRKK